LEHGWSRKIFSRLLPVYGRLFYSYNGHYEKKCYPPCTHENICPEGGLVLAICKAQFEGEALWMLMAFKVGVPQGKYPFSLRGNFMLRNDQANSSKRLLHITIEQWIKSEGFTWEKKKKKWNISKYCLLFVHNFFLNWENITWKFKHFQNNII